MLLLIFYPIKNQEKKKEKYRKRKSKLEDDIHEESLEDWPSWCLKKITSEKAGEQTYIRLVKGPFSENIFIWGKKNINLDRYELNKSFWRLT